MTTSVQSEVFRLRGFLNLLHASGYNATGGILDTRNDLDDIYSGGGVGQTEIGIGSSRSDAGINTMGANGIPWELVKALHDLHPKPFDALTSQAPLKTSTAATSHATAGTEATVEADRRHTPAPLVYLPTIPLDSFQTPGSLRHLVSTLSERLVFDAINIGSMLGTTMSAANAAISAAMISSLLDAGMVLLYGWHLNYLIRQKQ